MDSMRDVLRTLTDAATVVDSEAHAWPSHLHALHTAISEMRIALDGAHRALDNSQHLIIFTEGGKVTRVLTDHESNLSCMVVNWDVKGGDVDQHSLVEVEWPETKERSKVLIDSERIEHEPGMVGAIVQAEDELREKAFAALKTLKS